MLNLTIKKAKVSFSTKPTFKKMVKTMRAKIHKFARKGKLRFNQFNKPNTLIINMLILNLTAMLSKGEGSICYYICFALALKSLAYLLTRTLLRRPPSLWQGGCGTTGSNILLDILEKFAIVNYLD